MDIFQKLALIKELKDIIVCDKNNNISQDDIKAFLEALTKNDKDFDAELISEASKFLCRCIKAR